MSEAKHTPGPWKVGRKFVVGPVGCDFDQSHGMVIPVADVYGENQAADAALIAAAPELLAACADALDVAEDLGLAPIASTLRAAIAKATGERP